MLFGLWFVLYDSIGGQQVCCCFWNTRGGGGSWWEWENGDDCMEWEWGWEVATCWGTGTKTSRNHMPICKVSALCDFCLWWAARWELRGHECAERALPATVIHPLKGQSARSSACSVWYSGEKIWLQIHWSTYLKSHCFSLRKSITKLAPELYKE